MRVQIIAFLAITLAACGTPQAASPDITQAPAAAMHPDPRIDSVLPNQTRAGKVFNRQPSGLAAFSVTGSGFVAGAVVTANGTKLETAFGSDQLVTALMPAEIYAQAGRVTIRVTNPDGASSDAKDFEVVP